MNPSILQRRRFGASSSFRHRLLLQLAHAQKSRNPLEAGFTLVELLVVLVIIGILTSIGITSYLNTVNTAASTAARAFVTEQSKKCTADRIGNTTYTAPTPAQIPDRVTTTIVNGTCAPNGAFAATGGGRTWTVTLDGQSFPLGAAVGTP